MPVSGNTEEIERNESTTSLKIVLVVNIDNLEGASSNVSCGLGSSKNAITHEVSSDEGRALNAATNTSCEVEPETSRRFVVEVSNNSPEGRDLLYVAQRYFSSAACDSSLPEDVVALLAPKEDRKKKCYVLSYQDDHLPYCRGCDKIFKTMVAANDHKRISCQSKIQSLKKKTGTGSRKHTAQRYKCPVPNCPDRFHWRSCKRDHLLRGHTPEERPAMKPKRGRKGKGKIDKANRKKATATGNAELLDNFIANPDRGRESLEASQITQPEVAPGLNEEFDSSSTLGRKTLILSEPPIPGADLSNQAPPTIRTDGQEEVDDIWARDMPFPTTDVGTSFQDRQVRDVVEDASGGSDVAMCTFTNEEVEYFLASSYHF